MSLLLVSLFCFIPCLCTFSRSILLFVGFSDIIWWIRLDDLEVAEIATAIFYASLLQLEPLIEKLSPEPVQDMEGPTMAAPPPYMSTEYTLNNEDGVLPQAFVQSQPAYSLPIPNPATLSLALNSC
ncbi:hypothetical protein MMC18_001635 [Xylographa bjoerkii]|nr:hypothetical protein [Xylographa bjoerkii]